MAENKATRGSVNQIILGALLGGDKYGYEICKEIEQKTNGALILKQPSLYSSLRRMEEQKLIDSYWQDSDIGGKRHYYKLTSKGNDYIMGLKQDYNFSQTNNNEEEKDIKKSKPIENNSNETPSENISITPVEESTENDKFDFNTDTSKLDSIKVVKQESLFNLTKTNKQQPKMIEETKEEEKSAYFQFDLFNTDAKFIKSNEDKNFQTPPQFSNKFAAEDIHHSSIQSASPIEASEQILQQEKDLNKLQPKPQTEQDNLVELNLTNDILDVEQSNLFEKIENDDSLTELPLKNQEEDPQLSLESNNTSFMESSKQELKEPENSLNREYKTIGAFLKTKQELIDNKNIKKPEEDADINFDFSSLLQNSNILDKNEGDPAKFITQNFDDEGKKSLIENNIYLRPSIGKDADNYKTSDEFNPIKYASNESANGNYIFNKNNTSSKVYNNYQDVLDNLYNPNKMVNLDEKINVNFDEITAKAENLEDLKTSFKNEGIKLKEYSKFNLKFKPTNGYINYNKLNMFKGFIIGLAAITQTWLLYMILSLCRLIYPSHIIIYIIATAVFVAIPAIYALIYYLRPDYNIVSNYKFVPDLLNKFLAILISVVFIFAINLFAGMTSLNQLDYISYWLLPTILSINFIISAVIYYLLLKSKKFCV